MPESQSLDAAQPPAYLRTTATRPRSRRGSPVPRSDARPQFRRSGDLGWDVADQVPEARQGRICVGTCLVKAHQSARIRSGPVAAERRRMPSYSSSSDMRPDPKPGSNALAPVGHPRYWWVSWDSPTLERREHRCRACFEEGRTEDVRPPRGSLMARRAVFARSERCAARPPVSSKTSYIGVEQRVRRFSTSAVGTQSGLPSLPRWGFAVLLAVLLLAACLPEHPQTPSQRAAAIAASLALRRRRPQVATPGRCAGMPRPTGCGGHRDEEAGFVAIRLACPLRPTGRPAPGDPPDRRDRGDRGWKDGNGANARQAEAVFVAVSHDPPSDTADSRGVWPLAAVLAALDAYGEDQDSGSRSVVLTLGAVPGVGHP